MSKKTKFVRLKPLNPRRGFKLRSFISIERGIMIKGSRGWYEMNADDVDYLATVCQNGNTFGENEDLGLESIPAFDTAPDLDGAREIESSYKARKGKRARDVVGTAENPIRVSRPGRTRKRKKSSPPPSEETPTEELTSDQLAEIRQNKIDAIVANNDHATIKDMVRKREGLDVSLRKGSEELAAAIVDFEDEKAEFGDDD